MHERTDDVLFLAGLFCGAAVGAMVAALLVPQSSTEIREQVAERGLELKSRAEDVVQRAQQIASETVVKVQATAQDMLGGRKPAESGPEGADI